MTDIDESTIALFIPAWGERHLEHLRRFALPSVLQPGNLQACGYSKIIVLGSTIGTIEPLMRVLAPAFEGIPGVEFQIEACATEESALLGSLRATVRYCIERKCRMMLVMPDTIIANGGLFNMREYSRGKPVSIAAPHLRVVIDGITAHQQPWPSLISPQSLVNIAFANAHQSLTDAFSDRDNGTHKGGISLTRISDRLTTIIHYLPTVYLAWFTESDADFFDCAPWFGEYDHSWDQHLCNEGRLRVVSDSEFFFAVELTDPASNRIDVVPGSRLEEHSEFGCMALKPFVGTLHG